MNKSRDNPGYVMIRVGSQTYESPLVSIPRYQNTPTPVTGFTVVNWALRGKKVIENGSYSSSIVVTYGTVTCHIKSWNWWENLVDENWVVWWPGSVWEC